jgi:hypothetical protein
MEKNNIVLAILAVLTVAFLAFGVVQTMNYSEANEENALLLERADATDASLAEVQAGLLELTEMLEVKEADIVALQDELAEKESTIATLEDELSEIEDVVAEDAILAQSASFDDLSLIWSGAIVLDDNDLDKLGDYEIEFDGEDIEVEEFLLMTGEFASNDKDFNGETMLKFSDGDLVYVVEFDEDMSALDYDEDEFEFTFLGNEFTVTDWKSDEIVLDANIEVLLAPGEISPEGIEVVKIGEDAVILRFEGESQIVDEGDTEDFGEFEVEVDNILYEDSGDSLVVLKIADDVDQRIESGDEYDLDDNYEWYIDENEIALVLVEDFDEDDSSLKEGEYFSLFDDYFLISFELDEVDYQTLFVEYESATEVTFEADFEDAEGDIYFNGSVFIDEDDEKLGQKVYFENSDYYVEWNAIMGFFISDAMGITYEVDVLNVDGDDYTNSDDDVKSEYGFIIKAPEDDLEDGQLEMEVPEEQVYATILVA